MHSRFVVKRRSRYAHQRTRFALGQAAHFGVFNLSAPRGCAHHFFALISFMISTSRSRLARSFFSRAFSCASENLLFLMTPSLQGSHLLKFQLVRKSPGRSNHLIGDHCTKALPPVADHLFLMLRFFAT